MKTGEYFKFLFPDNLCKYALRVKYGTDDLLLLEKRINSGEIKDIYSHLFNNIAYGMQKNALIVQLNPNAIVKIDHDNLVNIMWEGLYGFKTISKKSNLNFNDIQIDVKENQRLVLASKNTNRMLTIILAEKNYSVDNWALSLYVIQIDKKYNLLLVKYRNSNNMSNYNYKIASQLLEEVCRNLNTKPIYNEIKIQKMMSSIAKEAMKIIEQYSSIIDKEVREEARSFIKSRLYNLKLKLADLKYNNADIKYREDVVCDLFFSLYFARNEQVLANSVLLKDSSVVGIIKNIKFFDQTNSESKAKTSTYNNIFQSEIFYRIKSELKRSKRVEHINIQWNYFNLEDNSNNMLSTSLYVKTNCLHIIYISNYNGRKQSYVLSKIIEYM